MLPAEGAGRWRAGGGPQDSDLFAAALLVALELPLEVLVLVREDELVGQIVLVEVVNQVPEPLLVLLLAPELA